MGIVALKMEEDETLFLGEMQMRGAGDPSILPLKLACLDPTKAVRQLRKWNPELSSVIDNPAEATDEEQEKVVSAVLDFFSAG